MHFFIYFVLGTLVFWTLDGRMPKTLLWGLLAAVVVREAIHWKLDVCVGALAASAIYLCGRTGNLGKWLNFAWLQRLAPDFVFAVSDPLPDELADLAARLQPDRHVARGGRHLVAAGAGGERRRCSIDAQGD